MNIPFNKSYTVQEALTLGEVYDDLSNTKEWLKIDPDPKVSYAYLMRSILNELERNANEAILEFLRAYILSMPPEQEDLVIHWINNPETDNPIQELLVTWNNHINK
mgnify:CR=1 FL=1